MGALEKKLLFGCTRGNATWVRDALSQGASPDTEDVQGRRALYLAAGAGHAEVCDMLLEAGADLDVLDEAIAVARTAGHTDTLRVLEARVPAPVDIDAAHVAEGYLIRACDAGDLDAVATLLDAGVDPDTPTRVRKPLAIAARTGNVALAKRLIDRGAQLELRDRTSPLGLSADRATLELLLDAGADLHHLDVDNRRPLHTLCARGESALAERLVQAGAHPGRRDAAGETPVDIALRHGATASLLRALVAAGGKLTRGAVLSFCAHGHPDGEEAVEALWAVGRDFLDAEALRIALAEGRDVIAAYLIAQGVRLPHDEGVRDNHTPMVHVGRARRGRDEASLAWGALHGPHAHVHRVTDDVDVLVFSRGDRGVRLATVSRSADALAEWTLDARTFDPGLADAIGGMTMGDAAPSPWAGGRLWSRPRGVLSRAGQRVAVRQVLWLTPDESTAAVSVGLPTVLGVWSREGIPGVVYAPDRSTPRGLKPTVSLLEAILHTLPVASRQTALRVLQGDPSLLDGGLPVGEVTALTKSLAPHLLHPIQAATLLASHRYVVMDESAQLARHSLALDPDDPLAHRVFVEALTVLRALESGRWDAAYQDRLVADAALTWREARACRDDA